MKYKLVAFDVDGTLVDEIVYIWPLLHKGLGADPEKVESASRRFYSGEITFRQWAEYDTGLWIEREATRDRILEIISGLKPMPGSLETLNELKQRGFKLAAISGGLDIVMEEIIPESRILFSHMLINRLIFDESGRLTGLEPNDYGDDGSKDIGLELIAEKEGISMEECVFIGDSVNDMSIMKAAGLGIGFMPHKKLETVCDVVIKKKDLREILRHL